MTDVSLFIRTKEKSVEDMMEGLRAYGNPRLYFDGKGWCCTVDMHVSSEGSSFTVRSDFYMLSTRAATIQCAERICETLKKYKELA